MTPAPPGMRDNITPEALADYRARYGPDVDGDACFAYVYGILHSPDYRERYADDLALMLPRIPAVETPEDFRAFAGAGQRLLDLHIGYEDAPEWPLREVWRDGAPDGPERWYVRKLSWAGDRKDPDRSAIVVNDFLTLSGIPDGAHRYEIAGRSALTWLMVSYRVKRDKASGIVNDPNDWGLERGDPAYIPRLVKRIVTVSVETMAIVDALPPLREAAHQGPPVVPPPRPPPLPELPRRMPEGGWPAPRGIGERLGGVAPGRCANCGRGGPALTGWWLYRDGQPPQPIDLCGWCEPGIP